MKKANRNEDKVMFHEIDVRIRKQHGSAVIAYLIYYLFNIFVSFYAISPASIKERSPCMY